MKNNKSYHYYIAFLIQVLCSINILAQTNSKSVEIGKSIDFNSKVLNEKRTIQIYLPDSYQNNLYSYPVLYVLDGEDNFLNAVSVVKNQSGYYQHIPEIIVVAISSANRNNFFSITDGRADKTLDFIKNELIPYIDSTYRSEKFRILFGHSLAGSFSFYTFSKFSYLFNAYIILSPGMHLGISQPVNKLLEDFLDSNKQLNKVVYIGVAEGDNAKIQESFKKVDNLFITKAGKGINYKSEIFSGEDHWTESLIGIYKGLNFIYKSWKIPFDVVNNADIPLLKAHTDSLSEKYGYRVKYPESLFTNIGMELIDPEAEHPVSKEKMTKAARELFEINVENYPKSSEAYFALGMYYMYNGQNELAKENFEKAVELNPNNQKAHDRLKKLKN